MKYTRLIDWLIDWLICFFVCSFTYLLAYNSKLRFLRLLEYSNDTIWSVLLLPKVKWLWRYRNVHRCRHCKAPQYLVDSHQSPMLLAGSVSIRSATQPRDKCNDGGATTSAIHCWPPSIRCARPHGLELLAGRPPRTAGISPLDSAWKHGFSLATSVLSALETSWQLLYMNSHLPLSLPLPFRWSRPFKKLLSRSWINLIADVGCA